MGRQFVNKSVIPNIKTCLFNLRDEDGCITATKQNKTQLNFKMLPSKTLVSKQEKVTPTYKKQKPCNSPSMQQCSWNT